MWRFIADENFNNNVLHYLLHKFQFLDIVRVQDVGLLHTADPLILEWSAKEGRILLTHDLATMSNFAYDRINSGLIMPGVFVLHEKIPISKILEDLTTIIEGSSPVEWENATTHLPF